LRVRRILFACCLLIGAGLLRTAAAAPASEPLAIVSWQDGSAATLLRGEARYALAPGVRLEGGDIVDVPDAGLLQLETADGLILALGPRSRLFLSPAATRQVPECFLLAGLAKASLPAAGGCRLRDSLLSLEAHGAVVLLQSSPESAAVFVERGEARASQAKSPGPRLKGGDYYSQAAGQPSGVIAGRPPPAFVAALPRPFLDDLASRRARLPPAGVPPKKTGDLTYADAEAWLKGPASIRRVLVPRWKGRAKDPEFRAALQANLKEHPEWDRILHPEKYLPPPAAPAPAAKPAVAF
jgi:hypothetical protein